jgi:glycerophosphoryl diester phosphodiesterase
VSFPAVRWASAASLTFAAVAGCGGAHPAAARASAAPPAVVCPVVVAHKGWHYPYWGEPENSLGALTAAARYGHAPWAETDVAMSRDGNPVIMHGGTSFTDVTGRTGSAADYTTVQLTAMRLREAPGLPYTAERLPTLWQYLVQAKALHIGVEVEESSTWPAAQFALYMQRLRNTGARWFTRVSGTSPAGLAKVRAAYPGEQTDLLVAPYWPAPPTAEGSVQEDVAFGDPRYPAYPPASLLASLRAQHTAIALWTPDDAASLTSAVALHPDMVVTDNLTAFHKAAGC